MIDIPGFSPTRRVVRWGNLYAVLVRPPAFMQLPEVEVTLSEDQFRRYQLWQDKKMLIQDALPELSASEREMLMTGLGDEDFHRITKDDDE